MSEKETLSSYVISLLNNGQPRHEIETDLLNKGHEESFVKELVMESHKLHLAINRSKGLTLILIGAVLCFAGFLLTITSPFSQSAVPYVLYGLTSVGILIAFAGFIKVF